MDNVNTKKIDEYIANLDTKSSPLDMCTLGNAYFLGYIQDIPMVQCYIQAEHWLRKSYDCGYIDAIFNLSKIYHDGLTGNTNYNLAYNLFKEYVEIIFPQNTMPVAFEAQQDRLKTYQLAAEKEQIEINESITRQQNHQSEFNTMVRKAHNGDPDAMYNMGKIADCKDDPDEVEAFQWYEKATQASNWRHAESMYSMGQYYEFGIEGNLDIDLSKANEHYERSAYYGHLDAKYKLDNL